MMVLFAGGYDDSMSGVYFYRDHIIMAAYEFIMEHDELPPELVDCLLGLLYGYRSDAIQAYVERQRARREDDDAEEGGQQWQD